jgi:ribose-phosphate pyrophosphokinase
MMRQSSYKIVTTEAAAALGRQVARETGWQLVMMETERYPNGQLLCGIKPPLVKDHDVALFQLFSGNVSTRIIELIFAIDLVQSQSPRQISLILPYVPYARSDRPAFPGGPVQIKTLGTVFESLGVDNIVCIELHSPQVVSFFTGPVFELDGFGAITETVQRWRLRNPIAVSPDIGGAKRAERLADKLKCDVAIIRKRRLVGGKREGFDVLGDVRGHDVVLVDDEVNTGDTLISAAQCALLRGAREVSAIAFHSFLTESSAQRVQDSVLRRLVVTDSVPSISGALSKIEVVNIADVIVSALRARIIPEHRRPAQSLSSHLRDVANKLP